ncbi:SAM-dependent methyltransferase, partial [Clostridium perfringens]|nr:SAM-dependent methyltransferase [Clostridium perfringens]
MNYDKLKEQWKIDEEKSFKGWDFSYLDKRWEEEKLPWDYEEILKGYLKPHYNLLDMGTGGGEFLLSLKHPYRNTSI